VMYMITITLGGRSAMFYGKRQAALGGMNAHIEEMINGQKVVKVFCYEERAKKAFDEKNEDLRKTTTKANILANILMPIMGNMSNVIYAVLARAGGMFAISGRTALTLGGIASFLALSKSFNRPVSQISQQINSVVMALAGAQRVFDLIDEEPEIDEGDITLVYVNEAEDGTLTETDTFTGVWAWKEPLEDGSFRLTKLRGDVRMKDVDFSYVPERQILYDINLYAKPGQKIAFVGSTGAGKTTITNLINRFYDIQDGQITYDGIDIKRIKKKNLRKSLGMVLQDVNLFTGSIRDNIRYGRLSATDEEVVEAAKLANAHSFIEKLPEGYDTVISGTGSQLSQGQCQLISIARCAVANPPVMILDEATSSIDTRTEALIQQGMDSLMNGRTVFVIAHRLSTVQNSNAIMVLEKGRIIERGDHDDLIAQKGRYYQLYTGMAE
ncbi:MAG: ABC transporter ATP-binding protein, partial [Firmicutes bacterium]|nr:ABC transporter ATP-binding protein [Bacillota bacterium]